MEKLKSQQDHFFHELINQIKISFKHAVHLYFLPIIWLRNIMNPKRLNELKETIASNEKKLNPQNASSAYSLFDKRQPLIASSILSADFTRLGEEVQHILEAGADMIHFDIMDGHYAPNLSFGSIICKSLREYGISAPFDVHLMVTPVEEAINDFAKAGADCITFHPDATSHIDKALQLIRDFDCKAGLAVNLGAKLTCIEPVMDKLDLILIMAVNPGLCGQQFSPSCLDRIRLIRKIINESGFNIRLEVEGGITANNIEEIMVAGADILVVGSSIFEKNSYENLIKKFKNQLAA